MLNVDIKNIILTNNNSSRELLNDIKFRIDENKVYTILGKNGSGKSTLIKSLTDLLHKELYKINGIVFWYDKNIFEMNYDRLLELRKKGIKYVMQDLTYNFDPLKKIKYYFEKSEVDLNIISKKLTEFLLPDYATISNLHPYEISGGMAQRLNLMLAILSNPKLLILDEPTSAIDFVNINLIKNKLKDFKNAFGSALIVTQDINFAREVSDEIAFLHDNSLDPFTKTELFFQESEQKKYSGFLSSFNEIK